MENNYFRAAQDTKRGIGEKSKPKDPVERKLIGGLRAKATRLRFATGNPMHNELARWLLGKGGASTEKTRAKNSRRFPFT